MKTVNIIGAGMMGSAMSFPARKNNMEVRLVGSPLDGEIIRQAKENGYHITLKRQLPEGVKPYYAEELGEALKGCDFVIGGISSFGIEWFKSQLCKIPENVPVLLITKGLHIQKDGSFQTFADYLNEGRKTVHDISAVGGPCISFELADGNDTTVAFCGHNKSTLEKLKSALKTNYYHIHTTTDAIGLETAVAMKNAYALGVSLAIGIAENKYGSNKEDYNPEAGLFYQSVKETFKLVCSAGGKPETTAFGAGDLYVTVFGGRTRKIGTLLGKGLPFTKAQEILSGVTLESVAIAKAVYSALKIQGKTKEFPLLGHIYELVTGSTELNIPWEDFTV